VADNLELRVFDGFAWSATTGSWSPFKITPAPNNPPSVSTYYAGVTGPRNQVMNQAALTIQISDSENDTITRYQLWDSTADPNSGHWVVNNVVKQARTVIDLTPAKIGDFVVPVDPTASRKMEGDITVGVRPEAWRLVSKEEGGLPIDVTVVEELGADGFVYGTSGVEGTPHDLIVRISSQRDSIHKGDTIYVTTDPSQVHVFDTASGERLSE
jgi:hypothetical protein